MATEKQLSALGRWLSPLLKEGEVVCEMPGEVCSAALTRLGEASDAYKAGTAKRGSVNKVKESVIAELKSDGWIDEASANSGLSGTGDAGHFYDEEEFLIDDHQEPEVNETFGERAQADAQKIREEQGRAPAGIPQEQGLPPIAPKPTVAELITKYAEILSQVTEAVNAESRIPDREKGYATKFLYDSVCGEMQQIGGDHEEQG